jgi:hypothetical protein
MAAFADRPVAQGSRVVSMTSKSGQKFTCVIPDPTKEVV